MKEEKIHHSSPFFDSIDEASMIKVLRSRYISSGKMSAILAKRIAGLLGRRWAVPVQSGTDALAAALRIMELEEGSDVAVPAYACSAPLDAVSLAGLRPVPVDIDRNTLAMDPSAVNRFGGLSAVIAAHLFGIPAPLHLIRNRNLVEDCAQTLAVRVGGRKVGSFGRLSICSFYATKLVTTGHGGAVAGDDPELFRRISDLFDHDNREEWEPHLHYRMSDLNAALGVGQLGKLGRFISCRRRIARRYAGALGCKVLSAGCYSRFLVVSERLDAPELAGLFSSCGIEAKSPVFKPVFMYLGEPASRFPNADWAYRKLVSVPIYPGMEECQVRRIEEKLRRHRNEISCWPPA